MPALKTPAHYLPAAVVIAIAAPTTTAATHRAARGAAISGDVILVVVVRNTGHGSRNELRTHAQARQALNYKQVDCGHPYEEKSNDGHYSLLLLIHVVSFPNSLFYFILSIPAPPPSFSTCP